MRKMGRGLSDSYIIHVGPSKIIFSSSSDIYIYRWLNEALKQNYYRTLMTTDMKKKDIDKKMLRLQQSDQKNWIKLQKNIFQYTKKILIDIPIL